MQASWVEIPVTNLERAMAFYQAVFGLGATEVYTDEARRITVLANPTPEGRAGVSLNQTQHFTPAESGTLVYFDVDGDLQQTLDRVAPAGGEVVLVEPKSVRSHLGSFATIRDTEHNLLMVHSAS